METSLPVLYIRHYNLESESLVEELYDNKWIGVHYANIKNLNQEFDSESAFNIDSYNNASLKLTHSEIELLGYNPRTARTAISYLNECYTEERLIVASYQNIDEIHIGVSTKLRGTFIGKSDRIDVADNRLQIKYVALKDVETVNIEEFPMPFLNAPRGTFFHWEMGREAILEFYNSRQNKKLPKLSSGMLSSSQLEALCEEWMREKHLLRRKLFSAGGSLKTFDIIGLNDDDEYVVAQVKFVCNHEDFYDFAQSEFTNMYLFTNSNIDNKLMNVITIDEVIRHFDAEYLLRLAFGNKLEQFK